MWGLIIGALIASTAASQPLPRAYHVACKPTVDPEPYRCTPGSYRLFDGLSFGARTSSPLSSSIVDTEEAALHRLDEIEASLQSGATSRRVRVCAVLAWCA